MEYAIQFVELYDRGWDSLTDIRNRHKRNAVRPTDDRLIEDLRQRGLSDESLVVWGGECGRTPVTQISGLTDDFGYHAAEDVVNVRDLYAPIIHLLGIGHHLFKFKFKDLISD